MARRKFAMQSYYTCSSSDILGARIRMWRLRIEDKFLIF